MMFHTTASSRLTSIRKGGLRPNSKLNHTQDGVWAEKIIGQQPLYFSTIPWYPQTQVPQTVLSVPIKTFDPHLIVPDLPRLIDHGMMTTENYARFYWKDDSKVPNELKERTFTYAELRKKLMVCIELTKSFAYLGSIPPQQITETTLVNPLLTILVDVVAHPLP